MVAGRPPGTTTERRNTVRASDVALRGEVRFAVVMEEKSAPGRAADVLSLCRALRDGVMMLGLDESARADLLSLVAVAEQVALSERADDAAMQAAVRPIRYVLVEVADGPIAVFMADSAAQIVGDGIGRMFF